MPILTVPPRYRDQVGNESAPAALTAMLAVNPEYQSALRDAEAESWDGPGIDAAAMIEAASERRRTAQEHDRATVIE